MIDWVCQFWGKPWPQGQGRPAIATQTPDYEGEYFIQASSASHQPQPDRSVSLVWFAKR